MKATFLLSIAALVALAAAQSPEAAADRTVETNVTATPSPVLEDATILDEPTVLDGLAFSAADDDLEVSAARSSSSSKFRVWSEANSDGRKQTTSGSTGCHRLDGRAVASYEGFKDKQYAFYKGRHCDGGSAVYTSQERRIKRISPRIYPRSVRILNKGTRSSKRSLTVWSSDKYRGDRQKFYPDRECFGKALLESRGGDKSSTRRIRPRSVYIYRK
ncbi:hypothetical protein BGZ70_005004 [Mortierella alpina]|uniref:Uncharacterized protein n=1 Tax=Mortierella alpina TaxID=64518 RepID=A0A9P6IT71_MORAP|nr:hypothetical protein BGZ70_005004 [Mortierella alpina]